ncbi:hypothetical protein SAMN05192558_109150 [Actinokineospora alba]|uniref:Uncharacterized protein n=1 Tax=Actinokineospora alba TaxID=504798 RepID=A0A1H0SXY0_9PSEU|nr:hypothetical protein [Actinokineospora alba]TDP66484.1 hypothetical protein C8E96_1994 [Actinokineospora alba]SDJ52783.1 hypothetical protein SAMN05421871_11854 [Actinokineospora alba]SDP46489.1 hypothetical protein SAMN05192558_109150 [Actinokineospora alba]
MILAADPTATSNAALVVAIVSATITLFGIVWQVFLYRLSGARVAVSIRPAVLYSDGTTMRGPAGRWDTKPPFSITTPKWFVDLVQITVINVGRQPITISNVALDRGRHKRWGRQRSNVRPFPLGPEVIRGATSSETIRLEVGAHADVYFDIWPYIVSTRTSGSPNVNLRASVDIAGRRAKLSSKRSIIDVRREQQSLRSYVDVSNWVRAYQAFWRHSVGADCSNETIGRMWRYFEQKLNQIGDFDKVQEQMWKMFPKSEGSFALDIGYETLQDPLRRPGALG